MVKKILIFALYRCFLLLEIDFEKCSIHAPSFEVIFIYNVSGQLMYVFQICLELLRSGLQKQKSTVSIKMHPGCTTST